MLKEYLDALLESGHIRKVNGESTPAMLVVKDTIRIHNILPREQLSEFARLLNYDANEPESAKRRMLGAYLVL